MHNERTSGVWIVATVFVLAALVGAYIASYFLRSSRWDAALVTYRRFDTDLEARLFQPAAKVETVVFGKEVTALRAVYGDEFSNSD